MSSVIQFLLLDFFPIIFYDFILYLWNHFFFTQFQRGNYECFSLCKFFKEFFRRDKAQYSQECYFLYDLSPLNSQEKQEIRRYLNVNSNGLWYKFELKVPHVHATGGQKLLKAAPFRDILVLPSRRNIALGMPRCDSSILCLTPILFSQKEK